MDDFQDNDYVRFMVCHVVGQMMKWYVGRNHWVEFSPRMCQLRNLRMNNMQVRRHAVHSLEVVIVLEYVPFHQAQV